MPAAPVLPADPAVPEKLATPVALVATVCVPMVTLAPISSVDGSPANFRSCGRWPIEANGKIRQFGPIVVRNELTFFHNLIKLPNGSDVFYDLRHDIMAPARGWFLGNDSDLLYINQKRHFTLGVRATYFHMFYPDSVYEPGDVKSNNNDHARVGLGQRGRQVVGQPEQPGLRHGVGAVGPRGTGGTGSGVDVDDATRVALDRIKRERFTYGDAMFDALRMHTITAFAAGSVS